MQRDEQGQDTDNSETYKISYRQVDFGTKRDHGVKLKRYGNALEKKYGDVLRLRRYAVVALGFERLWWEEIKGG